MFAICNCCKKESSSIFIGTHNDLDIKFADTLIGVIALPW